ncbi:MAG TPA: ATP-binding protein [Amycolatopsis sp.]|nr:ATP-binding protein [Amycolatopsis sp.]
MRKSAEIDLTRAPEAARQARRFVDDVCAEWRLVRLRDDAEIIASELVENTLRHTASVPRLVLEHRPGGLTVSVSDGDPARAYVCEGGAWGGFGMLLVARTAADWGCAPDGVGGKKVWAKLATAR